MNNFSHIRTWVFDLDNTLYDAEPHIFPSMERQMTGFVADRLKISTDAADRLRLHYYQTYGTTLRGLMTEHNITPDDFLQATHNHDLSAVPPCPLTREGISRLPGRRVVFTNAPRHFAVPMLAHLGLDDLFDDIFTIENAHYEPKPHPETYDAFLQSCGVDPAAACMFEDSAANLKPAHDLGMTTVWFHTSRDPEKHRAAPYIHHVAPRLNDWLRRHILC